jgi:hypothetical protein
MATITINGGFGAFYSTKKLRTIAARPKPSSKGFFSKIFTKARVAAPSPHTPPPASEAAASKVTLQKYSPGPAAAVVEKPMPAPGPGMSKYTSTLAIRSAAKKPGAKLPGGKKISLPEIDITPEEEKSAFPLIAGLSLAAGALVFYMKNRKAKAA